MKKFNGVFRLDPEELKGFALKAGLLPEVAENFAAQNHVLITWEVDEKTGQILDSRRFFPGQNVFSEESNPSLEAPAERVSVPDDSCSDDDDYNRENPNLW